MKIDMGSIPTINTGLLDREIKCKIDKSVLKYNKETQATELFDIKDRFKRRAQKIAEMIKEKQDISRKEMIGKLDKLNYKFGNNIQDQRFRNNEVAGNPDEKSQSYNRSRSDQLMTMSQIQKNANKNGEGSENEQSDEDRYKFIEIEKKHNLGRFDIAKLHNELYRPIFIEKSQNKERQVKQIKSKKAEKSFLDTLKETEDFGGSMINPPGTEKFLVEDSTLRGQFIISTPIYNEISPKIDFGDEIINIFREQKLVDAVPFDFYGNYNEYTLKKEKSPLDPLEYSLQISGYIIEKDRLFHEKKEELEPIDPQLLDYLNKFFPDSGTSDSHRQQTDSNTTRLGQKVKFVHSKVRYYERSEKHQLKRNFQVQVEIQNDHERTLTLNDFQNKMKHLIFSKKKLFSQKGNPKKTDIDAYIHELEDTLDIILNLRPDLLRSGIYQTLNQKVKLLLNNLHQFKGVYLGKLYCLEMIGFLLREVLEVKFGMNMNDLKNLTPDDVDGFKDLVKRRKIRMKKKNFQQVVRGGLNEGIKSKVFREFKNEIKNLPLLEQRKGHQYYNNSLTLLEKTLQAMKSQKRFQRQELEEQKRIRAEIVKKFHQMKEVREVKKPENVSESQKLPSEQLLDMFGESGPNSKTAKTSKTIVNEIGDSNIIESPLKLTTKTKKYQTGRVPSLELADPNNFRSTLNGDLINRSMFLPLRKDQGETENRLGEEYNKYYGNFPVSDRVESIIKTVEKNVSKRVNY